MIAGQRDVYIITLSNVARALDVPPILDDCRDASRMRQNFLLALHPVSLTFMTVPGCGYVPLSMFRKTQPVGVIRGLLSWMPPLSSAEVFPK